MKSYYKNKEKEIKNAIEYQKLNPDKTYRTRIRYEMNHPFRTSANILTKRARNYSLPFDDLDTLEKWLRDEEKKCYYCGVSEEKIQENKFNFTHAAGRTRLQIDRVVPESGYVVGNIVLACVICNSLKGKWFDRETTREIGQKYVKKLWAGTPDN